MIVKEIEYYQNGSAVVNPNRRNREEDKKKYDELRKSKRNREKRRKEQIKRNKRTAMQAVVLIGIVGMFTLGRDSKVYTKQAELKSIKSEIASVKAQNEALKVTLLKNEALDNIQVNAEERLGMVFAKKENLVEVDLSKDYFEELNISENVEENTSKGNILSKIKDILN